MKPIPSVQSTIIDKFFIAESCTVVDHTIGVFIQLVGHEMRIVSFAVRMYTQTEIFETQIVLCVYGFRKEDKEEKANKKSVRHFIVFQYVCPTKIKNEISTSKK